ncbi:hypothetical protein EDB89DRAFT_2179329 [Lactarius sanguifluus]|nr:hypothetical protein EDB89DRAFT_2179329 [Lactarius sanguifluus]
MKVSQPCAPTSRSPPRSPPPLAHAHQPCTTTPIFSPPRRELSPPPSFTSPWPLPLPALPLPALPLPALPLPALPLPALPTLACPHRHRHPRLLSSLPVLACPCPPSPLPALTRPRPCPPSLLPTLALARPHYCPPLLLPALALARPRSCPPAPPSPALTLTLACSHPCPPSPCPPPLPLPTLARPCPPSSLPALARPHPCLPLPALTLACPCLPSPLPTLALAHPRSCLPSPPSPALTLALARSCSCPPPSPSPPSPALALARSRPCPPSLLPALPTRLPSPSPSPSPALATLARSCPCPLLPLPALALACPCPPSPLPALALAHPLHPRLPSPSPLPALAFAHHHRPRPHPRPLLPLPALALARPRPCPPSPLPALALARPRPCLPSPLPALARPRPCPPSLLPALALAHPRSCPPSPPSPALTLALTCSRPCPPPSPLPARPRPFPPSPLPTLATLARSHPCAPLPTCPLACPTPALARLYYLNLISSFSAQITVSGSFDIEAAGATAIKEVRNYHAKCDVAVQLAPYIITSPFYDRRRAPFSNILVTSSAHELKSLTYRRLDIDLVADVPQILANIPAQFSTSPPFGSSPRSYHSHSHAEVRKPHHHLRACKSRRRHRLLSPIPAVAHDRNNDSHEHAAGHELGQATSPPSPRIFATRKSTTTTPPHESPPQRHAVVTRKTHHHANPLPASPVVTPPNRGVQDPATANTHASPYGRLRSDDLNTAMTMATTAGTDSSKDDDNDIDNTNDTRPATMMVTNARLMTSRALARGSGYSPPLSPYHTSAPPPPFTGPTTPPPPSWRTRLATAVCHRDMQDPPQRQSAPMPSLNAMRKIRYDVNPFPARPSVRHHASRKPRRDVNAALMTPPPLTRSDAISMAIASP